MLSRLLSDYAAVSVLAFDTFAAQVFDGLVGQRIRIGSMDLRIASVALTNRLTLLTRKLNDFRRVPGLTTEDWTASANIGRRGCDGWKKTAARSTNSAASEPKPKN
jgi:tRNA(fMet)-specific endonuclease VapC